MALVTTETDGSYSVNPAEALREALRRPHVAAPEPGPLLPADPHPPKRNNNIRHALRAIFANEQRYLLSAQDIRVIVYGVTGRPIDKALAGGWSTSFRALTCDNPERPPALVHSGRAPLWYRCDDFGTPWDIIERTEARDAHAFHAVHVQTPTAYARILTRPSGRSRAPNSQRFRLTPQGRTRLYEGEALVHDLSAYDACAWLPKAEARAFRTPHWWLEHEAPGRYFVDSEGLNRAGRTYALRHLGMGDFGCTTPLGDVEVVRTGDDADAKAGRTGRSHRINSKNFFAQYLFLCAVEELDVKGGE